MNTNALRKESVRYSWLVSLIISVFLLVFHGAFRIRGSSAAFFSLLTGGRFFLISLFNIFLLIAIRQRYANIPGRTQNLLRYGLGYILSFLLCLSTESLENHILPLESTGPLDQRWPSIILEAVINNTLVIIMLNFVVLRFEKARTQLENSRLRAANLESANLLLKQQIHPHFLFNALSMMKSLYKTDVHAGETYLSHLVNFLRASLTSPSSGLSSLADEIRLCKDYLEMQHVRFQNALLCSIQIPEEQMQQGYLPSFALQSLIENAIKHNEVSGAAPLTIRICYQDDRLITENNFQPRRQPDSPSGKGLMNLIERYKILSGDEVIIRQDNHTFLVSIKILQHENSDHRR